MEVSESVTKPRLAIVLWATAVLLLTLTAGLYFFHPSGGNRKSSDAHEVELKSTIAKASTYYEFGHYERAVETYADAVSRGMNDAIEWYRYARSIELSGTIDLKVYAHAYRLLLEQAPGSDETTEVATILSDHARPFDYTSAMAGETSSGALVTLTGTVARITWGPVEDHTDWLTVATRPDPWLHHMGDNVRVAMPRFRRFQSGETISIVGWYTGTTALGDGAGMTTTYPVIQAVGATVDAR